MSPPLTFFGFVRTTRSPLLNPFFNLYFSNISFFILYSAYCDSFPLHHCSKFPGLCSMLSLTTATTGCVVPSNNPNPGYNKNFTIKNASITLTIQLNKLSSFHTKFQNFFKYKTYLDCLGMDFCFFN